VFFRDQQLDAAQFMAFARSMGRPIEYPFVKGIEGFPEVIEVKKLEHERHNFGGIWHSDTAYLDEPPMGSMLLAREIPPYGGDTEFASQYAAYEALSDGMKRLLDGLFAVNSSAKADVTRTREDRVKHYDRQYEAEHPVVRTHPETGRKALYLGRERNGAYRAARILGISRAESDELLDALWAIVRKEQFAWYHTWRAGDYLMWDNRCVMHRRASFSADLRRIMHRTQIRDTVAPA